jgi:ABC-2 type transport system ATP-binding protein
MAAAETVCDRVVMISAGRTVFEGAMPDAAALAPHGAVVVTADAEGLAAAARSVGGDIVPLAAGMGEAARWRVTLPRHVTHPALVRALAERGVPIFTFQPIEASLEGAFWQLADPQARHCRAA